MTIKRIMCSLLIMGSTQCFSSAPDYSQMTPEEYWKSTGITFRASRWVFESLFSAEAKGSIAEAKNALPNLEDEDPDRIELVPIGYGLEGVMVPKNPPKSESSRLKPLSVAAGAFLVTHAPDAANDARIPSNPIDYMRLCFPDKYRKILQQLGYPNGEPQLPQALVDMPDDPVAAGALEGPFSRLVHRLTDQQKRGLALEALGAVPDYDLFEIDLQHITEYPVASGLATVGGRALMAYNSTTERLETIALQNETIDPWFLRASADASDWRFAQRRMAAAMLEDVTINDHLGEVHLAVSCQISGLVNLMPKDHPVRELLAPTAKDAIGVNTYQLAALIGNKGLCSGPNGGFFRAVFSHEIPQIVDMMNKHRRERFSFEAINPYIDAQQRNFDREGDAIRYPALAEAKDLWEATHGYVRDFLALTYASDRELTTDEHLKALSKGINRNLRPGTEHRLTRNSLTEDLTRYMVSSLLGHHRSGVEIMNWAAFPMYFPSQVPADGSEVSIRVASQVVDLLVATAPTEHLVAGGNPFRDYITNFDAKERADRFAARLTEIGLNGKRTAVYS